MRLLVLPGALLIAGLAAAQAPTPTPTPQPTRSPRLTGGSETSTSGRAIGAGGSSLADIARRQKEQREREGKKPSLGVISNESLRKGGAAATPTPASQAARGRGRAAPTPAPPPTPVPIPEWRDLKGRTEADWRRMVSEARTNQTAAEIRVKTLEAEVKRLENDFYAWSDGNYRERVIKPAWDQARDDLAKARQELDEARARMSDLEEEARRSNAPPGWLR